MTILYTDGGCAGNYQRDMTKREMAAAITDSDGRVLLEAFKSGGSSNIAELLAIKEALVYAKEHGLYKVELRSDSRNNSAWISGRIGKKLNDRKAVLDLKREIDALRTVVNMRLVWVPRAKNLAGLYLERTVANAQSASGDAEPQAANRNCGNGGSILGRALRGQSTQNPQGGIDAPSSQWTGNDPS